jgi:bacteriorhodopsin
MFAVSWLFIVNLVRMRLDQFYPVHSDAGEVSKSTKGMLKTALMVYFSIWCGYPTLWILKEIKVIDAVTSHCIHVFLDVFSKSGASAYTLGYPQHVASQPRC